MNDPNLVELHNGTIHAENLAGHGASFTIALPLWKDLLSLDKEDLSARTNTAMRH